MKLPAVAKRWLSSYRERVHLQFRRLRSRVRLRRLDTRVIPNDDREIRLFGKMRNESTRLPYFLTHYFEMGVNRIFLIDNLSADSSVSIALERQNVHVFETRDPFHCYADWIDILLSRYGRGHWCLVVDLDELFMYPHFDSIALPTLTRHLELENATALRCVLLDMYSDKLISEVNYEPGQDPLEVFQYFDSDYRTQQVSYWDRRSLCFRPGEVYVGGTRERVFGITPWISKVPLFRCSKEVVPSGGMHIVDGVTLSSVQGALLHFKYLSNFAEYVRTEADRGAYWNEASEYKAYARRFERDDEVQLFTPLSRLFEGWQTLVRCGIMKSTLSLEDYSKAAGTGVVRAKLD